MQLLLALSLTAAVANTDGTLLTLSAEGEVQTKPDLAIVSLGVTTEGDSATAAMAENRRRMNALVEELKRAGVAERDIQTTRLSIQPQQVYAEGKPPRVTGYRAENVVTAKVRDLANVGRAIDAAIKAGGNTLQGVQFALSNPERARDEARREAMARLRERAQVYASAAGLRVARIVSITEESQGEPPGPMMFSRAADVAEATPVLPGEVETRAMVKVVYELR